MAKNSGQDVPSSDRPQKRGTHQGRGTPTLTPEQSERLIFNAELDARIRENAALTHVGDELAREGLTTVALDRDGQLVEYRPDGTTSVLD